VFFSCKKLVAAKKQMSILQAPNILVIQLKVGWLNICFFIFCYVINSVSCNLLEICYTIELFDNTGYIVILCFCNNGVVVNLACRDSRAYWVARLIKLLDLKRLWCFLTSCAKQARYRVCQFLHIDVNIDMIIGV
jgi:hypothetical protein